MTKLAEIIGAFFGVFGTALIASGFPFFGFICYFVSNIALIFVFYRANMYPVMWMQSIYFVLTIYGLYTWLP